MDANEIESLVKQLKATGLSEEDILDSFYETFKEGNMDRKDLEACADFLGYELTDKFKNDSTPDPIATSKDETAPAEGGEVTKEDIKDADALKPGETPEEFQERIEDIKEGEKPEETPESEPEDKDEGESTAEDDGKENPEEEPKGDDEDEEEKALKMFGA